MPGERVDRTAVGVVRERDFGPNGPPGLLQHRRGATHQRRVTLVEKAIKIAAAPAEREPEVTAEMIHECLDGA